MEEASWSCFWKRILEKANPCLYTSVQRGPYLILIIQVGHLTEPVLVLRRARAPSPTYRVHKHSKQNLHYHTVCYPSVPAFRLFTHPALTYIPCKRST